jgi:hypothetical protein
MVMNTGEKELSWSSLTDMWQFYLACPKSAKVSHIFGFAECKRVAVGVKSDLANGGQL